MTTTTSKPSIQRLIESTSIPAALVRAVVRQMGGWESFSEKASDICRGGIDGGFNGFLYNRDTEPFASRNRSAIEEMASAQAREFGISIFEMVKGFGCFRHGPKPFDEEIGMALYAGRDCKGGMQILNALAWYAGEEVARAYCDAFDPHQ
ncbi:MAG: hypothetical protein O2960_25885 [Verrucomicrobia bacterium]|nr:hypothetical protein [Verrucomicrobiota bacterium]